MNLNENPAGKLVYFDSLSGLVKCKVISFYLRDDTPWLLNSSEHMIKALVTDRSNRVYKTGEIIETSNRYIVERDRVYTRSGQYYIRPLPYPTKE